MEWTELFHCSFTRHSLNCYFGDCEGISRMIFANCLNAVSVGLDEVMLSSLSGDIYPSAFIVYYPVVDSSSADTGLHFIMDTPNDFSFTVQAACRALIPVASGPFTLVSQSHFARNNLRHLLGADDFISVTIIRSCPNMCVVDLRLLPLNFICFFFTRGVIPV